MKNLIQRILSSLILFPFIIYIILKGSYILIFFTLIIYFIANYEWFNIAKNYNIKILGFIFLIFSFYSFFNLSIEPEQLLFVIFVSILTDIGGYVFGKILKGPKLTKISPNKTYTGMLGSYFLTLFTIILSSNYFQYTQLPLIKLMILTFVLSTISQIGDITISYFKRKSNMKNTGHLIPGHGGLLDRIDGMIFSIPTFYIINKFSFINL